MQLQDSESRSMLVQTQPFRSLRNDRQLALNPVFWSKIHWRSIIRERHVLVPLSYEHIFIYLNIVMCKETDFSSFPSCTLHCPLAPTVLIVCSRALVTKYIWKRRSFSGSYILIYLNYFTHTAGSVWVISLWFQMTSAREKREGMDGGFKLNYNKHLDCTHPVLLPPNKQHGCFWWKIITETDLDIATANRTKIY